MAEVALAKPEAGQEPPQMTQGMLDLPPIDRTKFEQYRDELDEHHERRERVVKASRDITGHAKKMIFSLHRVKSINQPLPTDIAAEVNARLSEIGKLLLSVAPDLQDVNRYRYARQFSGLEELVEALTFSAYLRTSRFIGPEEVQQQIDGMIASASSSNDANVQLQPPLTATLDIDDYVMGVFDLSGEIMRFATTNRQFVLSGSTKDDESSQGQEPGLSVLRDMQLLESMMRMLPPANRHTDAHYAKSFARKMETLLASVHKVEMLAYGLVVRGSERPEGWLPDVQDADGE